VPGDLIVSWTTEKDESIMPEGVAGDLVLKSSDLKDRGQRALGDILLLDSRGKRVWQRAFVGDKVRVLRKGVFVEFTCQK